MRFDMSGKMSKFFKTFGSLILLAAYLGGSQIRAQQKLVSAKVTVARPDPKDAAKNSAKSSNNKATDASNVAIWLVPLDPMGVAVPVASKLSNPPQLLQRNKTFEPHVLIVPLGTMVEFPNQDPFFHNIFSLYDGRRFDLGLYESGTKRSVKFDRSGVSFLFCNIHAEMSAVVLSVDTPYFALSDHNGNVSVRNVPDGRYQMHVWYERSAPEQLQELTRVVTISNSSRSLGLLQLVEIPNFTLAHKNKYGLDYVPPPNSDYDRP
jgi:plastocyanin